MNRPPGRPRKSDTETQPYTTGKNEAPEPTFMDNVFEAEKPKEEVIEEKIEPTVEPEEDLPLRAQPARRKVAIANVQLPVIAHKVYALVTTGLKGKIDHIPLHEIPLLRRKLFMQDGVSEKPLVLAEWQDIALERARPMTSIDVREEYKRLLGIYKFEKPGSDGEEINVLAEFYGTKIRELVDVMNRLYRGYKQLNRDLAANETLSDEQLEELVNLADPDFEYDFVNNDMSADIPDFESFEPKGAGAVIQSNAKVLLKTK